MSSLKVWTKFSVVTKEGTTIKLRIVDMPEYLYEKVVQLYIDYFVKKESTIKAAGIPNNEEAINEIHGPLLRSVEYDDEGYHIVICCLDNDDEPIREIMGASMMALTIRGVEPKYKFKTKEMTKLFEIVYGLESYYDEVKAFDLERSFGDRGLFVCPNYTGLGIARELLKVRRMICKEHGIPINGAWMTSYGTQKAAERDGWETVCEIPYEELEKQFGVKYDTDAKSTKFMIARIK
ncbi:uncharacterized protein LOC110375483 [Helicoverpa armigera]|uniref:uncharacterized protein LOC110375483 n=1 Tax=Helicoverpa armigera TaxID=29058 RepID=UPI0030830C58